MPLLSLLLCTQIKRGPSLQLGFCVHCGGMIIMYFSCAPSVFYAWPAGLTYNNTTSASSEPHCSMCTISLTHTQALAQRLTHSQVLHALQVRKNHTYTLRGETITDSRHIISLDFDSAVKGLCTECIVCTHILN